MFTIITILILLQVASADAGQCDLIKLNPIYVGEQQFNKTIYVSKSNRYKYELKINKRGQLSDARGNLLDTRNLPNGTAMFVYSKEGKIYISTKRKIQKFDHSSLVAGDDVIVAGTISIRRGYVKFITDVSGMYQTTSKGNLKAAVYRLKRMRANTNKMKVLFQMDL